MKFENSGVGKCVLLKEDDFGYSLIYSITGKQFIVASDLDKKLVVGYMVIILVKT